MTDFTLAPKLVQQYKRLQDVRDEWCNSKVNSSINDKVNETIVLDGKEFDSIPGFFLVLGEVANGNNGYFGACLDSLSDCLCGGFGLALPLTIEIHNIQIARERLGPTAIAAWNLLRHQRISAASDKHDPMNADSLPRNASDNYFDKALEVFQNAGARIKIKNY